MSEPAYPEALPALTRLHWYVLERVLGQGGFGITYLAKDTNLDQRVAIKEYLPVEFATRLPDSTVRPRMDELRDRYRWGLDRFIQEARTLARFDHPNIVRVHSVFEHNNTAYIVMRFEEGGTLAAMLDRRGTLPEAELLRILLPVLDGLELVHSAGFIHRDIKPDNIHLSGDGRPVLLDFGSARQAVGSSNTLTILIAPGYAPFEQYYNDPSAQGPWTDIYGLAATAYRAICGRAPLDAVSRSKGILGSTQEIMVPASVVGAGRYSGSFLAAVDHALAFGEKERPQTIADWRRELVGDSATPAVVQAPTRSFGPAAATQPTVSAGPAKAPAAAEVTRSSAHRIAPLREGSEVTRRSAPPWVWALMTIMVLIASAAVYFAMKAKDEVDLIGKRQEAQQRQPQPAPAPSPPIGPGAKSDGGTLQGPPKQEAPEPKNEQPPPEPKKVPEAKKVLETKKETPSASNKQPAPVPRREPSPAPKEPPPTPKIDVSPQAPTPAPPAPKETPPAPKIAAPRTPADLLAEADKLFADGRHAEAIKTWRPLAEAGNARAQERMGAAYIEGRGVDRNPAEARKWYGRAAEGGNTDAMIKLGMMYERGIGGGQSTNIAYIWYGTAAELGSSVGKAERERIGGSLQPAERDQGARVIKSKADEIKRKATGQ